jgi:hypothetical protein
MSLSFSFSKSESITAHSPKFVNPNSSCSCDTQDLTQGCERIRASDTRSGPMGWGMNARREPIGCVDKLPTGHRMQVYYIVDFIVCNRKVVIGKRNQVRQLAGRHGPFLSAFFGNQLCCL